MKAQSTVIPSVALILFLNCAPEITEHAGRLSTDAPIVLTGANIQTMIGPTIEDGIIVITGKTITKVTHDKSAIPANARIIDCRGKTIIPGYFDAYTHLGLVEIWAVEVTVDLNEKGDLIYPQLWTGDAYNTQSELIKVARANGVTTALSAHSFLNIIAGRSAIVNLADSTDFADIMVKKYAALHISIGEPPKSPEPPPVMSRMGIIAKLREALIKAKEYSAKKEKYIKSLAEYDKKIKNAADEEKKSLIRPEPPAFDPKMEPLIDALNGAIPVIIRAHRSDDILKAIEIAQEFKLKLILAGCAEGWMVADKIAKSGANVILGPINVQPGTAETLHASYQNASVLHKHGVKFAIASFSAHDVRNLPYMAGLAAAYGLPRGEALKAITIRPAEIFGVENLVGCIREGAFANLLVIDNSGLCGNAEIRGVQPGDPLQPLARIEKIFIHGREITDESRQRRLYEKYR